MTEYPCAKCQNECLVNANCICCDICDTWYHVSCSGLTMNAFQSLLRNQDSVWYCINCISYTFPYGQLGNKSFADLILHENQHLHLKYEIYEYALTNNFSHQCTICAMCNVQYVQTNQEKALYPVQYVNL